MRICILAVMEKRCRAIGRNNKLIWRLPKDMGRFVKLRKGKPLVMGRKTWESIPPKFRHFEGSFPIVVSSDKSYNCKGAILCNNFQQALVTAKRIAEENGADEVMILGGGQIYKEALPFTDRLYLTLVEDLGACYAADTFFPEYKREFEETSAYNYRDGEDGEFETWFAILDRK